MTPEELAQHLGVSVELVRSVAHDLLEKDLLAFDAATHEITPVAKDEPIIYVYEGVYKNRIIYIAYLRGSNENSTDWGVGETREDAIADLKQVDPSAMSAKKYNIVDNKWAVCDGRDRKSDRQRTY